MVMKKLTEGFRKMASTNLAYKGWMKKNMKTLFKIIRIIIQFLGFVLLRIIYEPLNRILVNKFGCGCKEGFNCNSLNSIIIFGLFAITVTIALLNIKIYANKERGICFAGISMIINIILFPLIWATLMWK